jgi:hypothetical protein
MKFFNYYITDPVGTAKLYSTNATITLDRLAEIGIDYNYAIGYVHELGTTYGPPQGGSLTLSYYASPAEKAQTMNFLKPGYKRYSSIALDLKESTTGLVNAVNYTTTLRGCRLKSVQPTLVQGGGNRGVHGSWAMLVKLRFSFAEWDTGNTQTSGVGNEARGWYF